MTSFYHDPLEGSRPAQSVTLCDLPGHPRVSVTGPAHPSNGTGRRRGLPGRRRAGVLAPARSLLSQSAYARICTRRVACFVFGRRIVKIPSFMVACAFSVSMSLGSTVR